MAKGEGVAACCMFGYVYLDGVAVAGAKVTITSAHGSMETWTSTNNLDNPDPYYRLSLSGEPLSTHPGETITITAEYSSHRQTKTYIVQPDGQQVDIVLSRTQALDLAFTRQLMKQALPGEFNVPTDVATNGANVYVVDTENARIQVFTRSGQYLFSWGTLGGPPGFFAKPDSIALDRVGNVYVTDTDNDRIQIFSPTGQYIRSLEVSGDNELTGIALSGNGTVYVADTRTNQLRVFQPNGTVAFWGSGNTNELDNPRGLAVGSDGSVYVADAGNKWIQHYSSSGQLLGPVGGNKVSLVEPTDVAVGANNTLYILDHGNHTLIQIDTNGTLLHTWGGYGNAAPQLAQPQGMAIDADGSLFIADTGNSRVQHWSNAGSPLNLWGERGCSCGRFNGPHGIALDADGNIYIADSGNGRIQKYDPRTDTFIGYWGQQPPDGILNAEGITIDKQGTVYIADTGHNRIVALHSDGSPYKTWNHFVINQGQFNQPTDIAIGPNGTIYVVDRGNNRIQALPINGQPFEWKTGQGNILLNKPTGIAVSADGFVYVADTDNHRIQKFSATGTVAGGWGGYGQENSSFSSPYGLSIDTNGNVYVIDTYNYRVQIFDRNGMWLNSLGEYGENSGQFVNPQGITVDAQGTVYVADTYNQRIEIFKPMRATRPIATLETLVPNDAAQTITLHAAGSDTDTIITPTLFLWSIDNKTQPTTTDTLIISKKTLSAGVHTISMQVRDSSGELSPVQNITIQGPAVATPGIPNPPSPLPPTAWTMLLYLDGDNDSARFLDDSSGGALGRLRDTPLLSNVHVVALYDGPARGDSAYYIQQLDGTFRKEAIGGSNGEVNMGNPSTLINFITWGRQQAPADHYYLAIADHANGLDGIAWDKTDGGAYLSNGQLLSALQEVTSNGNVPLDIVHLDGCSMGLLEVAYQYRQVAHYLIASEGKMWSAFAYDAYERIIQTHSDARSIAQAIADRYATLIDHEQIYPYTIATFDLTRVDQVAAYLDALTLALNRFSSGGLSNRTLLSEIRAPSQQFESGINASDRAYVDLQDWVQRLSLVPDGNVQQAADTLLVSLPNLIIREHHGPGGVVNDYQGAHGVALFYPSTNDPKSIVAYRASGLTFVQERQWPNFFPVSVSLQKVKVSLPVLLAPGPLGGYQQYVPIALR